MSRVRDLNFGEAKSVSTMKVDADVADLIRRVVRKEKRRLSDVLHDMLVTYVREKHGEDALVFDKEE